MPDLDKVTKDCKFVVKNLGLSWIVKPLKKSVLVLPVIAEPKVRYILVHNHSTIATSSDLFQGRLLFAYKVILYA